MLELAPQEQSVRQVADELRRVIMSGQFPTGSWLPSTRDLAQRFNISTRTINQVLRELEADNLVACEPRKRTRVTFTGHTGTRVLTVATSVEHLGAKGEGQPRWYSEILMGADQRLLEAGYHPTRILVRPGNRDDEKRAAAILADTGDPVRGVLLRGGRENRPLIQRLEDAAIPWVTIHRATPKTQYNFVGVDMFEAGQIIGAMLACDGRRHVLTVDVMKSFAEGNIDLTSGVLAGYVQHGGDAEQVVHKQVAGVSRQSCYEMLMQHSRQGKQMPDAVVCSGDYNAIGVVQACRDLGLRIPEDVAIIGGTGLELSGYVDPPLTVVDQPRHAIGTAMADMLIHAMSTGAHRTIGRVISPRIRLRATFTVAPDIIKSLPALMPGNDIELVTEHATGKSLPIQTSR